MGLATGLLGMGLITCLSVDALSRKVTAGGSLQMWDDFMRGNWPAVADAPPPRSAHCGPAGREPLVRGVVVVAEDRLERAEPVYRASFGRLRHQLKVVTQMFQATE